MPPVRRRTGLVAIALGLSLAPAPVAAADYYAGKTIDFIVGGTPGGGFDIYARALARHFTRHIPGNPGIVVKNMPGAGSSKAGIHVGTIAAKDGLTMGAVTPGAVTGPLLDGKTTLFLPNKVTWLGSANASTRICAVYETSKIKSFDDALKQKIVIAGGAHGDATHDYAQMISKITDVNMAVVGGYKGTLHHALAMERGEVDGMCGWDWSSAKSQKPEWLRDKKLRLLLQIGPEPNDELTKLGAPEFWKYVNSDENRRVAELIVSQQAFQRPYFIAGETPTEYVNILRSAFDKTMKDRQFLADAEKMRVDISPLPGADVQKRIARFYATPKDIVEKARAATRP